MILPLAGITESLGTDRGESGMECSLASRSVGSLLPQPQGLGAAGPGCQVPGPGPRHTGRAGAVGCEARRLGALLGTEVSGALSSRMINFFGTRLGLRGKGLG